LWGVMAKQPSHVPVVGLPGFGMVAGRCRCMVRAALLSLWSDLERQCPSLAGDDIRTPERLRACQAKASPSSAWAADFRKPTRRMHFGSSCNVAGMPLPKFLRNDGTPTNFTAQSRERPAKCRLVGAVL